MWQLRRALWVGAGRCTLHTATPTRTLAGDDRICSARTQVERATVFSPHMPALARARFEGAGAPHTTVSLFLHNLTNVHEMRASGAKPRVVRERHGGRTSACKAAALQCVLRPSTARCAGWLRLTAR